MEKPVSPVLPSEDLPLDLRVIALDETDQYVIDAEDAPAIKSILGIYLYDANLYTFCASSMPCYFLHHIENQVRLSEEIESLPEEAMDHIREQLEMKYAYYGNNEDFYISAFRIDVLAERLRYEPYRYRELGEEPIPRGATYDEVLEGMIEYCRCNAQL